MNIQTFILSEAFIVHVNALSRANPISTEQEQKPAEQPTEQCQCPKSGKPHFYESCGNPERHRGTMCQCPKSGKPHFYVDTGEVSDEHFNVCQCPKSGKPHFYPALLEPAYLAALRACFCRYFSEYSDN